MRVYLSEMIGTFILALAVMVSLATNTLSTPIVASLTLGLLVYILGPVSGCHLNPAVSFGLKWANKISTRELLGYVVSQLAGAGMAYLVAVNLLNIKWIAPIASQGMATGIGEILGTAMLVFGISMLIMGKISSYLSGVIVGVSLLVGIVLASATSAAVLNPAVAAALQTKALTYVISPLIGAVVGVELAKLLNRGK